MPLRWIVLLLLLANLGWWAAQQPPVAQALGLKDERDPGRLALQVHPERLKLHRGPMPVALPTCLAVAGLDEAGYEAAREALRAAQVPEAAWVETRRGQSARWGVVIAPLEPSQQPRKLEELRRRRIGAQALAEDDPLGPGLLLGEFAGEAEARRQLDEWQGRNVRTARVLPLGGSTLRFDLRVEPLRPEQVRQLLAPAPTPTAWQRCAD